MSVGLASRKEAYMFDGEYDPVVAAERGAEFILECDNDECSETAQGTMFELDEKEWDWGFSLDPERLVITKSESECPKCTGKAVQEMAPHEKAKRDPKQIELGAI